jgi:predicted AlkP superfamily phosphohydrolase/phosphomutase
MQAARRKVIAIVLESAEPMLVDRWCKAGKLPVLEALRKRGVWALLNSPSYLSSGCAWPTLNIGTNPAKHGIGFFHREIKNGTYQVIKKYADSVYGEPFWHRLGDAGFRSVIFDLATTLPSAATKGSIVVDWGSEHPSWKTSSFPVNLVNEVLEHVGRHPLRDWYQEKLLTKEACKEIADKLIAGVESRTKALQLVLQKEDFDFAFCNFAEPHWAGHMFWHLHDEQHPEYVPEHAAHCGDVIQKTYQACDRALGTLVAQYPDANILVISNVGIGTHSGGDMLMPQILERLGMSAAVKNKSALTRSLRRLLPGANGQGLAVQKVERWVGVAAIKRLSRLFPQRFWDTWTRRFLSIGNNWAGSRAFLLPGDNSSLIRINLQGREPRGRVQPGEDYNRLCSELAAAFMELIDPATGEKAVEKVIITRRHFTGDQIDQLPDLAVVWKNTGVPIQSLESPRIGHIDMPEFNKRSGAHWHDGFLIGVGPDLGKELSLKKDSLINVAPTILALFGLAIPDYMDGSPIMELMASRRVGERMAAPVN